MTPKEEAELLIFQYYDMFSIALENSIAISEAQSCALLAVDTVLSACLIDLEEIEYWEEVKKQIEGYEGVQ